jgi:hypothetical protein
MPKNWGNYRTLAMRVGIFFHFISIRPVNFPVSIYMLIYECANDPLIPRIARQESETRYDSDLRLLGDLNDPSASRFEPNVFATVDMRNISTKSTFYRFFLKHYMSWAKSIVRHETDIIMLTHLILYFTTALPSAIWLFCRPSYLRGVLHFAMQFQYMGSYTLMMHQHIHMRGILARKPFISWFDKLFPYVMDPLMGHTWNTYYYHHVKHHHIEGNGPDDLSSTVRYQRDDIFHLMHYIGRFFLLVWLDLPLYFIRKGRPSLGLKVAAWEITNYAILYATFQLNRTACCFVFLLPLLFTRLGLMIGNWGQHAFVDADDPESEYRSSITLIDVAVSCLFFRPSFACT